MSETDTIADSNIQLTEEEEAEINSRDAWLEKRHILKTQVNRIQAQLKIVRQTMGIGDNLPTIEELKKETEKAKNTSRL